MKTEQELIQDAWNVQNACNLSGVVHSFSTAITRLREIFNDKQKHTDFKFSTEDLNQHIISKLYVSKLLSLSGDLPLDIGIFGIKF